MSSGSSYWLRSSEPAVLILRLNYTPTEFKPCNTLIAHLQLAAGDGGSYLVFVVIWPWRPKLKLTLLCFLINV
jgi:hypothetical protein